MPFDFSFSTPFLLFVEVSVLGALALGALSQIGRGKDEGEQDKKRQDKSGIGCLTVFHLTVAAFLLLAMLVNWALNAMR